MPTPEERLANLEFVVRALAREVEALRGELRGAPRAEASGAPGPDAGSGGAGRGGPPPTSESMARTGPVRHHPTAPGTEFPRPVPSAPRPASPRPVRATASGLDLESLVGRYGAMALAALTIVMGVGALLRWAVEHVQLGPASRVALGALLAAALAAAGWWLRGRDVRSGASAEEAAASRRYGNTILGLALAVVHVDAWGAGPYLHVLPPAVALWIAALASTALATLAFSSGEQTLFAVGLGGALLAPFVTSTGSGTVPTLLGYGLVITVGGCLALGAAEARGRRWRLAGTLLGAGAGAYALAALPIDTPAGSWTLQSAPPAFAVLAAWCALALAGDSHRAPLARTFLLAAFVALAARAMDRASAGTAATDVAAALATIGALGAATAFATAHAVERDEADPSAIAWGALLPTGFLADALVAVPDTRGLPGTATAAAWALLAATAARLAGPRHRQPPLIAAGLATSAAIILGADTHPVLGVALLAAQGTLFTLLAARLAARGERAQLVLAPAIVALAGAGWWAADLLEQRTPYAYTPFATLPSLAALAAVAGWTASGLLAARVRWTEWGAPAPGAPPPENTPLGRSIASLGAAAAFLWGRAELAHASSPDLATFLLIGYYAAAGVAAILVGRLRAAAGARRAGLALAVYAALKALAQASSLADVALRVGSYLLVGLFLLAVAYWYRGGNGEESLAAGS